MGLLSTLGSIAGSFFGGPTGGSIGGALGGFLDGKDAESGVRQTNALNYQQTRELRQTAYQDTVKDLNAAGLNPMMAYSQGATGATQQRNDNPQEKAAQQAINSAQASNIMADTENKRAQSAQIRAQTALMEAQEKGTNATTANTQQQTVNLEEVRQNLIKEGYNLTEVGNLTRAQVELNRVAQALQGQQINESTARELVQRVEAKLKDLQIKGAENLEAFEKTMGSEGGNVLRVIQLLRSILR